MFKRHMVRDGGLARPSNAGDGLAANFVTKVYNAQTDATITISELSGGSIVQGSTLTSDVIYTLPTAVAIAAAAPDMNLGDSFSFAVKNSQLAVFDVVINASVGITTIGTNNTLSTPPQSTNIFTLTMTGDTAGAETFTLV